jgi:hypothetical protein
MGGHLEFLAIWCYRGGEFLYRLSPNKRTRLRFALLNQQMSNKQVIPVP